VRGEMPAGIHQNHPTCPKCLKEEKSHGRTRCRSAACVRPSGAPR
jgi:tRNA(Ile2) C34 agmatinyltransferase TiaS